MPDIQGPQSSPSHYYARLSLHTPLCLLINVPHVGLELAGDLLKDALCGLVIYQNTSRPLH